MGYSKQIFPLWTAEAGGAPHIAAFLSLYYFYCCMFIFFLYVSPSMAASTTASNTASYLSPAALARQSIENVLDDVVVGTQLA